MTWRPIAADQLSELVGGVTIAAWRWECQGDYSAIDSTLMQRWRDGLGRDPDADADWLTYVGGLRRRGARFERLRMITDPPTEYLRMQLVYSDMNVRAGEDLRWISQQAAREIGAPSYDYYLLDSQVAVLDFDVFGILEGVRLSEEAEVVNQHRSWRDQLWAAAVPHDRLD